MRVPLSWLKTYIDIRESPEELAESLTSIGIEVEKIVCDTPSFAGVVVAEVVKVLPHPQAEKLRIAEVNDGKGMKTVVCGAPNCREGIRVALANVGAKIQIQEDGSCNIEIKKTTLRGIESCGMLCSEEELGLGDDADGIIELSADYSLGEDLSQRFSDVVFEIGLTPNLGHCLSIEGIARELSAILQRPLLEPLFLPDIIGSKEEWEVDLLAREECPSYSALVIENCCFRKAPLDMRLRLQRAGIRPQNLIVDCGNYVMVGMGQPLHTFDAKAFPEKRIVIDQAKGGEMISLLDSRIVEAPQKAVLITNGKTPCAIAGVMGSIESSVTQTTQKIVVESAFFDPKAIRRAGKKTGTFTEALRRFERGIDPNGYMRALKFFWHLFSSLCPSAAITAVACEGRDAVPPKMITCRRLQAQKILGRPISQQEMEIVFSRLGYPVTWSSPDVLSVAVPAYRHDVSEEIDLIEDIAKLTGFASAGKDKPPLAGFSLHPDHPLFLIEKDARRILSSLSLQEFVTCDLISPSLVSIVADQPIPRHSIITVMNPVSQEQSVLRPSLFPGLVDCLCRNISRGEQSVAAFEVGVSHLRNEGKCTERLVAGILLSGQRSPRHFTEEPREVDFFDMKGIFENFVQALGISNCSVRRSALSFFHDGRQATAFCENHQVGVLGEIHPKVLDELGIRQRVYFMELDLQDLFSHRETTSVMKPLSIYPSMERDWTITIEETMTHQELIDAITPRCSPLVEDIQLLSVFRHERIGAGKKNVSLRFTFRDPLKTLTQQEVDDAFTQIVRLSGQSIGVNIRGSN
jgi:phenylalanyl-tRNA synthetase beta chain